MQNNEELSKKEEALLEKLKKVTDEFQKVYFEEKEINLENQKK